MSDVAVREQTPRLKSSKVSLAKQESKQRRDFTQKQQDCQSAQETRAGRREQCCRKTGSTALPHGESSSRAHRKFSKWESPSIREQTSDSAESQTCRSDLLEAISHLQVRSEPALIFYCAKLRMFFLFPLYFLPTGFSHPHKEDIGTSIWGHHLSLLTIRCLLRALGSPAVQCYHVVPGQKQKVKPKHHTGSVSCTEEMWDGIKEYLHVHWCKTHYFPLFPPCLSPLLTDPLS